MAFFAKEILKNTYLKTKKENAGYVIYTLDEVDDITQDIKNRLKKVVDALASEKTRSSALEEVYERRSFAEMLKREDAHEVMIKDIKARAQAKYDELFARYTQALGTIDEILASNALLEEENIRQAALNRHYKRLGRERANRDNGQSKKNGLGYAALSTSQFDERVVLDPVSQGEDDEPRYAYIKVWKTVLATPYSAALPLEAIRRDIRTDLIDSVLGLMGVEFIQTHENNGKYTIWKVPCDGSIDGNDGSSAEEKERIACSVYRWRYRSVFRDDNPLWEIELYHNMPIFVPEELRPVWKDRKDGGRRSK